MIRNRFRYSAATPAVHAVSRKRLSIIGVPFSLAVWLAVAALLLPAVAAARCHTHRCHKRVHAKRAEAWVKRERPALWQWRHELPGWRAWVMSTARCESNLRWHIATGNGFYGGLQFTPGTWYAAQALVPSRMRTRQMPHVAPWYLQGVVAIAYAKRYGQGAWPVCG